METATKILAVIGGVGVIAVVVGGGFLLWLSQIDFSK